MKLNKKIYYTKTLFLVLPWIIAIFFGYWYIYSFSVNVPWWDLWDSAVVWTLKVYEGRLDFVDFLMKYSDSRLLFPMLISVPILILSKLNIKIIYIVGFSFYLFGILFLIYLLYKDSKLNFTKFTLLSTPILFYALNPVYLVRYTNNLGSFIYPLMLLFAFLSIHYLFNAKKSFKYLYLAAFLAFASSFSYAGGFAIWFAGLIQLTIQKMDFKLRKILIWCFSAFLVFFTHFYVLGKPPYYSPDPKYSIHNFDTYLMYINTAIHYPFHKFLCFLCAIGSEISRDPLTALFFGAMIFSILIAIIFINRKNLKLDEFARWYGLLFFAFFMLLELVVTRSGDLENLLGPPDNIFFIPDYRHQPVVFLPLIFVYVLSILYSLNFKKEEEKFEIKIFLKSVLFTLLLCTFILNFSPGLKTGENFYFSMLENQIILKTFDCQSDENLRRLYPSEEIVKIYAKKLKELKLNVFSTIDEEILVCKFSNAKIFPLQSFVCGTLKINNDLRFVLYQHPISNENRSIIEFRDVYIPENAKLKFGIALHPAVWDPEKGDGVVFEIYISDDDSEELVFSKYIDPKKNLEERKWNDFEIDLSEYAGKNVTIVLSTLPGPKNDANWDWAFWGDLRIEK